MNLFLLKKIASTKIKQESTFLRFTNYVYEIYAVKAIFIMLSSTKTFFQTNKQMCGTLSIHMYIIEFLYSSSFYKINISRWGRILKFYHHREKNDTSNSLIFKLKKITNLKTWRIDMCWHLEYSQTTLTPLYKTVSITGLITLVSDLYWASQINAHNKKKKNSHT